MDSERGQRVVGLGDSEEVVGRWAKARIAARCNESAAAAGGGKLFVVARGKGLTPAVVVATGGAVV